MPFSYTNRQGKVHYFKIAKTKNGKERYYVTTSDQFENLMDQIPKGYEVAELPYDAKVVIRKKKPILITEREQQIVYKAIEELSDIKDFFIHTEEDWIYVFHSQFNYVAGQEENLTREEAMEMFGDTIEKWMKFYSAFRFQLVDNDKRLFQTERIVFMGFSDHSFHPIGSTGPLEQLTTKYAPYLGRDIFFDLVPNEKI